MFSFLSLSAFSSFLVLGALAQSAFQQNLTSAGIQASFPGDSNYASASKPFNLRYTYQPAAVVFPKTAQDVSTAIKSSVASGFTVVARGGGHSYVANGLGGKNNVVVIDMSNFKAISVDSSSGTATIEMGNRLGDVALALNKAGRALPHGTCSYVGIGGHSGHGGFGFTSRMWGLTLDTILSMNVVLANGTIVTASSTSNPDLFWAMRGAASSFGITTSITVQTFAAPSFAKVFEYDYQMTASQASSAMAAYQSFVQTNIPAELGMEINMGKGSSRGSISFSLAGAWYGAQGSALNNTLAPLLAQLPKPQSVSFTGNGTYIDSVRVLSETPLNTSSGADETDTFYAKSLITPSGQPMTAAAISAYINYLATTGFDSSTDWFTQVELYGGANSKINTVPLDSTSFVKRDTLFTFQLYASSSNHKSPYPSSGFSFVDGMANAITSSMPSNWSYSAYLNYIDDRLSNYQQLYYGSHYSRLESIKKAVDPNDVFIFPTSVEEPGSTGNSTPTATPKTIHPSASSSKCVGLVGGTFADGTQLDVYDCNGSIGQNWLVSGGAISTTSSTGDNYCFDAGESSGWANGLQMKVWTCFNNLPQQNWTVSSSGQIKLAGTNFCLDLTNGSTANRNILQLWTCSNGNANQVWTM